MARQTLKSLQEQIDLLATDRDELLKANENIYGEYTMLSRRVEELSFIDLNNITGANEEILPQAKRVQTILRLRRLRHENPMAKQAIKLALRFVLGKGITFEIRDSNTKRILEDFWNDPVNQVVWTSHFAMVSNFDELLTDGEQFLALFDTPGETPYVRIALLPMEEVTHILYDPDNGRVPVWYRRIYKQRRWDAKLNGGEGGWQMDTSVKPTVKYYRDFRVTDEHLDDIEKRGLRIPKGMQGEGKVKHRMVNPVKMRSGVRGVSELFASREWFRVFKEFMEDRGAINAMANALAYQRKITGGPVAVAGISGKLGGLQVTADADQPLTPSSFRRPLAGSVLDTNRNVDYQSIRADTGAPNAVRDAELIRSTAGAGTATPDHYFGSSNAALAGAQSIEVAVVKVYEDFQTFLRNDDRELAEYILSIARDMPISEVTADAREIAWNFPPIATHDLVKWVTAYAQWAQQIAPHNREVRAKAIRKAADVLGISDIEMIWDEIEAEEQRLADQEDEDRDMKMEQQQKALTAPVVAPGAGFGGNGAKPPFGGNGAANGAAPAGTGSDKRGGAQNTGKPSGATTIDPDTIRSTRGKPPREGSTGPRSRRQ